MIYKDAAVFDFETTGLKPENATVLEPALLRIRNGKVTASYTELLNPNGPIPEYITKITGINDSDVMDCRTWSNALITFLEFISDETLLIAYNAAFDLGFLNYFMQEWRGCIIRNPFLDVRGMAIHAWPYKDHKLKSCCEYAGIMLDNAHRAFGDVEATWKLAKHLWENWEEYRVANREAQPREWYLNRILHYRKYRNDPPFVPEHGTLELVG